AGSWLSMLATPVLSSAWSSTSSTRARTAGLTRASAGNVHLHGQRRGIPGDDDLGAFARPGDDGQRGADALGALLHAGQAEPRRRLVADHAAAVVGDREADADRLHGRGPHRDPARPRMADGIGERFLRDADDLALDRV